jgi:hypothetical protein
VSEMAETACRVRLVRLRTRWDAVVSARVSEGFSGKRTASCRAGMRYQAEKHTLPNPLNFPSKKRLYRPPQRMGRSPVEFLSVEIAVRVLIYCFRVHSRSRGGYPGELPPVLVLLSG